MFLETLVDFVTVHREDLQDWLFVLLTQLLKKMGADLLGSVQAKVQKALDITRLVTATTTSTSRCHHFVLNLSAKNNGLCSSALLHDIFPQRPAVEYNTV